MVLPNAGPNLSRQVLYLTLPVSVMGPGKGRGHKLASQNPPCGVEEAEVAFLLGCETFRTEGAQSCGSHRSPHGVRGEVVAALGPKS